MLLNHLPRCFSDYKTDFIERRRVHQDRRAKNGGEAHRTAAEIRRVRESAVAKWHTCKIPSYKNGNENACDSNTGSKRKRGRSV